MPPGWDDWRAVTDARGHVINENGALNSSYPVKEYGYPTDLYRDKALPFLKKATDQASNPPILPLGRHQRATPPGRLRRTSCRPPR